MKEIYQRDSVLGSSTTSRSQTRDCDRDSYTQRKPNSASKLGKTKKKKSKKKRYRSSSSSSSASKTSTRSRGSIKSNESTQIQSKEHLITAQATSEYNLDTQKSISTPENKDSFTVKPLFDNAGSKKILQKVIIDLKNETVSVEKHEENTIIEKSQIFHPNFLGDDMRKVEKWAKKLYNYRQKTFNF